MANKVWCEYHNIPHRRRCGVMKLWSVARILSEGTRDESTNQWIDGFQGLENVRIKIRLVK